MSDLTIQVKNYLRALPEHVAKRRGAVLLGQAVVEVERLQEKLKVVQDLALDKVQAKCKDAIAYRAEHKRMQADIQYALDRLANKEDQGEGLRELIDAATNSGDYFPSCEVERRKKQIDDLNRVIGGQTEFHQELIEEIKRLKCEAAEPSP